MEREEEESFVQFFDKRLSAEHPEIKASCPKHASSGQPVVILISLRRS